MAHPGTHRRRTRSLSQELRQLGTILTSRWLVSLAGAVSACLVLWFLGPLLSLAGFVPFETEEARLLGVLVLMVVWGILNQMLQLRERQAGEEMIAALVGAGPASLPEPILVPPALPEPASLETAAAPPAIEEAAGDIDEPGAGEVRGLQRRLAEALALYARRCGRLTLRRLPWYLVIGTPGAGKTTALANSGLSFPLADILGHRPVQGFAGTRSCDWWFTSEAVLVDTAGRYTSQDSNSAADSAAWLGLLDLLKFHRPGQPLNGVVVTISLADLAAQPLVDRHIAADALNWRLTEIEARLGTRVPVYVVLTKADRLTGFSEFFADQTEDARRQVWGITFPAEDPDAPPGNNTWAARFTTRFELLAQRLERRLFERLTREPDPVVRALIASFPQQLASLRPVLTEFLVHALQPADLGRRTLLRGVYLTSAKREGGTIDRMAPELAATFGVEHRLPEPDAVAAGGVFLNRLFREVIFAETHLAGTEGPPDRRSARRRRQLRLAALAGLALSLVVGGYWGWAGLVSHRLFSGFEDTLGRAAALMPAGLGGGSQADRVADGDVDPVLPVLSLLRGMPGGVPGGGGRAAAAPVSAGGLDQGERLHRMAGALYQRALRRLFYPRLIVRLETALVKPAGQPGALPPDRLYEALRVYLMLVGEAPLDRYTVTRWFSTDWIASLPGDKHEAGRRQLSDHLATLLDTGNPASPGSARLVAEVRKRLAGYPLAARGYAQVRETAAVRDLPGWHLLDHVGRSAALVLASSAGRALSEPVAGLYTAEGARRVVLPAVARVAIEVAQDGWVLGLTTEPGAIAARARQLRQGIATLYLEDFARHWQDYLKDLGVATGGGVQQMITTLEAAAGPASPLPAVIAAVVAECRIVPAGKPPADDEFGPALGAATEVANRFKSLQQLLVPGTGRSQIAFTGALNGLGDLHDALEHWEIISRQPGLTNAAAKEAQHQVKRTADRIKAQAAALPAPVSAWIATLAEAGHQSVQGGGKGAATP
ncbi:MAG: type VI secretion system membrane subunit TssM [Rhodospirillaceae bacterium]